MQKQIEFGSKQENVTEAVIDMVAWLKAQGISDEATANAEIVLAEALNNVVEHSFEYNEDGNIQLEVATEANEFSMIIKDNGNVFPGIPQKKEMKGEAVELDDLPEGGFGWFLIHELTNEIFYTRLGDLNALELRMTH